jgi:hypothetical protein
MTAAPDWVKQGETVTAVRLPSCVMSPCDWMTPTLRSCICAWRRHRRCCECRATTDTRVCKDASTLVTCVHLYSILLFYLFIVSRSSCITRPIASSNHHQPSNMPPSNSPCTSSSASPPSIALTICMPRLHPATLQALAHRRAPLSPPHSSTPPGSRTTSCVSSRTSLSPPQDICELQVWSRVAMVEVGNLTYW